MGAVPCGCNSTSTMDIITIAIEKKNKAGNSSRCFFKSHFFTIIVQICKEKKETNIFIAFLVAIIKLQLYLKEYFTAHSSSVGYNWFLVLSFTIPTIKLYTSTPS